MGKQNLTILGAGSWGLTLTWLSCINPDQKDWNVTLWDRTAEKIAGFEANRRITFPVEVEIPAKVRLTSNLAEAITDADIILMVVTSNGTRSVAQAMKASGALSAKTILVNCSKGIEAASLKPISDVLKDELPDSPFAVLSGPSLAKELLAGLPTACSIASHDEAVAEFLQSALSHETLFRLYSNTDVVGVELGGSLKNVFAITSGYMRAKNLGDNAQAALITRGLAEMTRFSVALGADAKTLYGLSGLGDMLATCNSPLSRNYQVGARLAQGESLEQILNTLKVVAEGVKTTYAVNEIARRIGLDMPIVKQVEACLSGPFSEKEIIKSLMSRKLKSEQSSVKPQT